METILCGVRYTVKCQNLPDLVWLAEEMLSALECTAAFLRLERIAFLAREFVCTLVRDDNHHGAPRWSEVHDFDQAPRLIVGPDIGKWLDEQHDLPDSPIHDFVLRALLSTTIDPPDAVLAEHQSLAESGATQMAYGLNVVRRVIHDIIGPKRYALSSD